MSQLNISPHWLGRSITSPISMHRWGMLVGIVRKCALRPTILTDKSPRASQQFQHVVTMPFRCAARRPRRSSMISVGQRPSNGTTSPPQHVYNPHSRKAMGASFFPLSHIFHLGVSAYPHVRQKVILSVFDSMPEVDQRAGVGVHVAHFSARNHYTCSCNVKGSAENKQTE